MNPQHVKARNYRTFADLDLALPSGLAAVVGDNGAGKSSIVNLVDVCLFGPQEPFRTLADYLTADSGETEVMVELTFEHDGEVYRVRRGYSARGAGKTTLDLERNALRDAEDERGERPDSWLSLTRGNVKETQAELQRIIGQTRPTFRASSFLAQGDGGAFTEAKPADRQAILADALGLDVWAAMREKAQAEKRIAERTLDGIAIKAQPLETLVATEDTVRATHATVVAEIAETESQITAAEDAHAAAVARLTAAERVEERRAAARATVDAARAAFAEAGLRASRADTARKLIADAEASIENHREHADRLDDLLAELGQADAQRERRRAAIAERDAAQAAFQERHRVLQRKGDEGDDAEERARALEARALEVLEAANGSHARTCDRCQQTLGADAAARAAESYRDEAAKLIEAAAEIKRWTQAETKALAAEADRIQAISIPDEPDDASVREQIEAARASARVVADAQATIKAQQPIIDATPADLDEQVAAAWTALAHANTAADAIDDEPVDLDRIKREAGEARRTVDVTRALLANLNTQKGRCEGDLDRITEARETLATLATERADAQTQVDHLDAAVKAYGKDGIPALIIENTAIPMIETSANQLLDQLGTAYRVELRTQRALKSGDGLADTLDIVVIDDAGAERDLATYSGGEKTRIALALRIALANVLAHRRGAASRLLAIDEPDGLDEAGMERLRGILRGLETDGGFDRILLVSHVPALRDAFENVIEVVKVDGRSRVAA